MTGTRIASDLLTAYRQADYVVQTGQDDFVLNVQLHSAPLRSLHNRFGVNCSAVITACNPFGRFAGQEWNEQADRCLEQDLTASGCTLFRCTGRDPRGLWPEEPGFLTVGLPCETAKQLGNRYRQNAILCCDNDAMPKLVLLR